MQKSQVHKISVPRTAHYYTLGTPSKKTKQFWICTHGYGQAAERFIKKFDVVANEETFILAPEALSRFYWGGFTGDVVASWMTSGDRLDEIADYVNYLQTLYEQFMAQLPDDVEVILFGFSQGVATQIRWILQEKPHFHRLIMWAGALPDDLQYAPFHDYLADKKCTWIYGDQDQFLTEKRVQWHLDFAKKQGFEFEVKTFEGKHVVDRTALVKLVD